MRKQIGEVVIDVSPPEKPKFKSPLVLVHGLWSGSWCWSGWATRFSNLGWECWAINLRGRVEDNPQRTVARLTFDQCVEDLKEVIRAAGPSAVLLGHSLGGVMAMKAAEDENLSALILLSPPLPGNHPKSTGRVLQVLHLKYFLLVFLRLPIRIKERDFALHWLASLPRAQHREVLRGLVPESSYLVERLFKPHLSSEPALVRCPVLVVGGTDDRVIPVEAVQQSARTLGAEFKEYSGHGHWMMEEEGWEAVVNDVHRWVVQGLGEEILLAEFPKGS